MIKQLAGDVVKEGGMKGGRQGETKKGKGQREAQRKKGWKMWMGEGGRGEE